MPYYRKDRLHLSLRAYAVKADSLVRASPGSWNASALWVARKQNRTTVTMGVMRLFGSFEDTPVSLEDALAQADTRYGGNWQAQWNGERLLVEPRFVLSPAQSVEVAKGLDSVLRALPAMPAGYVGWFYPKVG